MRTFSLIIFSVVFISGVSGSNNLARIIDKDGFTNVRDSGSTNSKVVSTLSTEDFFICIPSPSTWWRITAFKNDSAGKQLVGYVHSSRIQLIDSLSDASKQALLIKVLDRHKSLATEFHSAFTSKNSAAYKTSRTALEKHSEETYTPILNTLSNYFCHTGDTVVVQHFLAAIIADSGSANEMPCNALCQCYICFPAAVIRQVLLFKNPRQRAILFEDIEYGLLNHYDVPEDGKSNNQDYLRLRKQLDNSR
jgi:hypothetical protein